MTRKHREQTMSQMSKIEAVATSDVDEQNARLLRDDELDAVSGGKAGGDKEKYMIVTMSDCLVTSFQPGTK
jgi:hypothetical protein